MVITRSIDTDMSPSDLHGPIPVGPGRTHEVPSFSADPLRWLEWLDAVLERSPELVAGLSACDSWTDRDGHTWRVVITPEGPELRPGLENPFLVHGQLPRLTALLVTPTVLRLELSLEGWREVRELPVGAQRVRDLGLAMLTRTELPHAGLDRVGPETWQLAATRWSNAGGDPDRAPDSASSPGTQRHPASEREPAARAAGERQASEH